MAVPKRKMFAFPHPEAQSDGYEDAPGAHRGLLRMRGAEVAAPRLYERGGVQVLPRPQGGLEDRRERTARREKAMARVALDVMGSDRGPAEVVAGARHVRRSRAGAGTGRPPRGDRARADQGGAPIWKWCTPPTWWRCTTTPSRRCGTSPVPPCWPPPGWWLRDRPTPSCPPVPPEGPWRRLP